VSTDFVPLRAIAYEAARSGVPYGWRYNQELLKNKKKIAFFRRLCLLAASNFAHGTPTTRILQHD
jgi:hypothetical protein